MYVPKGCLSSQSIGVKHMGWNSLHTEYQHSGGSFPIDISEEKYYMCIAIATGRSQTN